MESHAELTLVCPSGHLCLSIHPESAVVERKEMLTVLWVAQMGSGRAVGRQSEGVGMPQASTEENLAGAQPA